MSQSLVLPPEPASPEPSPSKGISTGKMILMGALSCLIVFVVWLFYPVKRPNIALRGMLPESTLVSVEGHDPAGLLQRFTQAEGLFDRFAALPLVTHLMGSAQLADSPESRQLQEGFAQLSKAKSGIIGLGSITALAFGAGELEGETFFAGVVGVDNIGILVVKVAGLFIGSVEEDGQRYSVVDVGQPNIPKLYFRVAPGTRYVLMASSAAALKAFRTEQPGAHHSRFTGDKPSRTAIELSVNGLPMLAGALPVVGNAAQDLQLKVDFFLDMGEVGGLVDVRIPNGAAFTQDRVVGAGARPTADFRGLSLSFAMSPVQLRQTVASRLPADTPLTPFVLRGALAQASGAGMVQIGEGTEGGKIGLQARWAIGSPEKARADMWRELAGVMESAQAASTDIMTAVLLRTISVEQTSKGARLRLPLMLAGYSPAFSVGDDGQAVMGIGAEFAGWTPAEAIEPGTISSGGVYWRHSPALIAVLGEVEGEMSRNSALLNSLFGPDVIRLLRAELDRLRLLRAALDSFRSFSLESRESASGNDLLIKLQFSGELAIDRQ